MITCKKCNKELEDGTKFCDGCGEAVETAPVEAAAETIFCQNCGKETSAAVAFCQYCGASLAEEPATEEANKGFALPKVDLKDKLSKINLPFKLSKKLISIAGAALAIILVVALILPNVISAFKVNNYGLYMKEDQMYYTALTGKKPMQITEDLEDGATPNLTATVTNDGKTIFYADKENGNTLYYRSLKNAKKDPVKIDSDVTEYVLNKSCKLVTYRKGDTLYQHNLKDKTKIASDVANFCVSEDGKKIVYKTSEGDAYFKVGKKDKVKIDSDIAEVLFVDEKLNTVYFTKLSGSDEDSTLTLYKKVGKKDKVKIASDVTGVLNIYESGEAYYFKDDSSKDEVKRDLCYYDGKKEKVIASDVKVSGYDYGYDEPVLVYSEVEYSDKGEASYEMFVAVKDKVTEVAADKPQGFSVSNDGKTIYFFDNLSEEDKTADLYKIKVSGNKPSKAEKYDSDVYYGEYGEKSGFISKDDDKFAYFKEYDTGKRKGELYIDKDKADFDVTGYVYVEETKSILLITDYSDDGTFTLKKFKNGKSVKISDDVSDFEVSPKGDIMYLKDYEKGKGDLYVYKNNKSKKIDEDVTSIISVISAKERREAYARW